MNPRERILAGALVCIVLVGAVGFGVWKVFLPMLQAKDREIGEIEASLPIKENEIETLKAKKLMLEDWRRRSLPVDAKNDAHAAWTQYDLYLDKLLTKSRFPVGGMVIKPKKLDDPTKTQGPRAKKPAFTRLTYNVDGQGSLASLVSFLEDFYNSALFHRIRMLEITKPSTLRPGMRNDDLDIKMVIEAFIVDGVKPRDKLEPEGPKPDQLAQPKRNYSDILARNIFNGPSFGPGEYQPTNPVEITRLHRLTTVFQNHWSGRVEAFFRDLAGADPAVETRLRATAGFDDFKIRDPRGDTVVSGKVVKIEVDDRSVVFKINDKYYRIHNGQSFDQAMRKPLTDSEVKKLNVAAAEPAPAASVAGKE